MPAEIKKHNSLIIKESRIKKNNLIYACINYTTIYIKLVILLTDLVKQNFHGRFL